MNRMKEPVGKLFDCREYFGGMVFREPRKGATERGGYVAACLGIGFILMFSADLLPKDRTRLAGYLRTSAFAVCFVAFLFLVMTWIA